LPRPNAGTASDTSILRSKEKPSMTNRSTRSDAGIASRKSSAAAEAENLERLAKARGMTSLSGRNWEIRNDAGIASSTFTARKRPGPMAFESRSNPGVASALRDPQPRRGTIRFADITTPAVIGGIAPHVAEMQAIRGRVSYLETLVEANRRQTASAQQERKAATVKEGQAKKKRT
jgi:hypothetical protein